MKASSFCAILLWFCWQFNSLIEGTYLNADVGLGNEDLLSVIQKEMSVFTRHLDDIAMHEYHRLHRTSERHRSKRSFDYRHGFSPNTGVGNREDSEVLNLEMLSNTSVSSTQSVKEWGFLQTNNASLLAALVGQTLTIFKLQLNQTDETLSHVVTLQDVSKFEIFNRPIWESGHIVDTDYCLTVFNTYGYMIHYKVSQFGIEYQNVVDLRTLTVIDLQHFSVNANLYLGVLTQNGYLRLYIWSSRFDQFITSEELSVPTLCYNMQAFHIYGRYYILVSVGLGESVLLKYQSRHSAFREYQLLFSQGSKRVKYFSESYEHYVVFIDDQGLTSTFFQWNGVVFLQMQVVDTFGANSWNSITVPGVEDGTLIILASNSSAPEGTHPFMTYMYDTGTLDFQFWNRSSLLAVLNPPEYYDAVNSLSFYIDSSVYLAVSVSMKSSANDQGNIFEIAFTDVVVADPVVIENVELEELMAQIESTITTREVELFRAREEVADSVTLDGDQDVLNSKIFRDANIDDVDASEIDVEETFHFPSATNESLGYLVNQSIAQQQQVQECLDFFDGIMMLNTTQTIIGLKTIQNMTIEGPLNSTSFTSRLFNDVDIDLLDEQAFRLDVPDQVINGALTFSGNLSSTASIDLDDGYLVNGLDLSEDVVLTHGEQRITGSKIFQQDTTFLKDMDLDSGVSLNEIDPSEHLVTLDGSHVIKGQLNFTDVVHIDGSIITDGLVDGVDVSFMCENVMTISTSQTISGSLVFQQAPLFNTDVTYDGLLGRVNITHLNEESVKINENTVITGEKTFAEDVSVAGDVTLGTTVNDVDLQQNVVLLNANGTLAGPRTFTGPVTAAGDVDLNGLVNKLNLTQDVVTLKGNHTITGKKTFVDGINAEQSINVTGNVDTVDLSAWANDVMMLSSDQTIQGPVVFFDDATMGANLTVDGLINDIDIQALYRDTFFNISTIEQLILGSKTFTQPVTVTSGHIIFQGLINGHNMTEDFLDKYSDQTITGSKTFVDGFSANAGLNVTGLIAGIDLMALYMNSLLESREAHLRGQRTFLGDVTIIGAVDVAGTVDGIDIDADVLTVNGNQIVTGIKMFQSLVAHNASVDGNVNVQALVNGRNWTEFVETRVDLTSDQDIYVNHSITASSVTVNDVDIIGLVNGVNLTALMPTIMSKTKEQTITGDKIFAEFIVHGNVTLGGYINGVDLDQFVLRAMLLKGPQTVTGSKTFANQTALLESLELTGLLDGVDLDFFMSDIIYPDKLTKILGTKTFSDGLYAEQDVVVIGTVDGIDLSTEVMTLNTAQNLTGSWTVTKNIMSTAPDTIVTGLINGINIVYLNNSIVKTIGSQFISSPLVFVENLTSMTDITVTGLVDGVDISELRLKAVMLYEPFDLRGNLTFTQGVTFDGYMEVTGLIYGLNLSGWYEDVVLLHTNEAILGSKTFMSNLTIVGDFAVTGDIEADTVFGRNFDDFVSDAVNLTGNVTITGSKTLAGTLTAERTVLVMQTVDGIYIEDIVTKDGYQVITGLKTFTQTVTSNNHITVTELVNGFDISDIYARSFMLGIFQNITAIKEFVQDLQTDTIIIHGLVDGIDLDQEAVTLNTSQTLQGAIFFNSITTMNGDLTVTGTVGGVTLSDLMQDRATLSGDEAVLGQLTFQGHVTFSQNVSATLFDGISLSGLWKLHKELRDRVWSDIGNLMLVAEDQCKAIDKLQDLYANALVMLTHVSEIQEIGFRVESFEAFLLDGVQHLALAINADNVHNLCVDSYIYVWNSTTYTFQEKAAFPSNGAYRWHAFVSGETQYLALANEGINPCYGESNVTNGIFYYDGSQFVELQQLDAMETREIDTTHIGTKLYLVQANARTTTESYLYLQGNDGLFHGVQNFTLGGATSVEFVHIENDTFLVFAAIDPDQSPIFIYNHQSGLFDLHQYVPTSYAASVEVYNHQGNVGVIFANHAQRLANNKISYNVPVTVYHWSNSSGSFVLFESIDFTGAVDVDAFHVGPDLYLVIVSEFEQLELFRLEGVVGFSHILSLASYGVVSVEVFEMPDLPQVENLFFAVAVNPPSEDTVFSRILQGKQLGDSVKYIRGLCKFDAEDLFHGDPSLLDVD
ncbi:uncharacterized protein LOC117292210 isoform X1 [Asterias rubens]|uniref:uncharacterized protein LOC117292210 isoform X1 n=1 Tax=Asterias rubens TaxID=7604 RepID=UPI001455015B|nr:uncharacterized protein LOC117292210 isoform X1 [Asterias rubens]